MSIEDKKKFLLEIADNPALLEIARAAVEDALIEFRDSRIAEIRNNGLVCKEANGTASSVIRFGTETAMRIGLRAIADKLEFNIYPKIVQLDYQARAPEEVIFNPPKLPSSNG